MSGQPDRIGPDMSRRQNIGEHARSIGRGAVKKLTTKQGLLGDYDYAFLFTPNLPFMKKSLRPAPFFGLDDHMPVILALLLGFQHALAMLAGLITPPLILSGQGGANLTEAEQQYLVSTCLIVSGILSCIQITRFHIRGTKYHIGTGLISVVGTSFAIVPVAQGAFTQMYANGFCPLAEDGSKLPCPDAYGALVGTSCLCALTEIGISFMSPRLIQKLIPPIVSGPTVMLIGLTLIGSGFQNWAGGNGLCAARPTEGFFQLCPDISAPHALAWGSAEYIGLGFSVFITILICERWGSPIMKSTSVIIGLLTGCIIAAATGYFDRSGIDSAPAASFIWVHTFKLQIYGPLVLPLIAIYIICACEAIGDITATCDVSRLEVDGDMFDSRIQGGILADGVNGVLAGLFTITPMTTFAQNNGVIALTRCANRSAGYCCCLFLIIMGVFSKFAAALVSIPGPVLGGMTTFLFSAVAVAGMSITSRAQYNRRTRFILTAALALGVGSILQPTWFSYVFTYSGDNRALQGFLNAITLVLETGFAVTAFVALILNLLLPYDIEDDAVLVTESEARDPSAATNTQHGPEAGNGSKEVPDEEYKIREMEV